MAQEKRSVTGTATATGTTASTISMTTTRRCRVRKRPRSNLVYALIGAVAVVASNHHRGVLVTVAAFAPTHTMLPSTLLALAVPSSEGSKDSSSTTPSSPSSRSPSSRKRHQSWLPAMAMPSSSGDPMHRSSLATTSSSHSAIPDSDDGDASSLPLSRTIFRIFHKRNTSKQDLSPTQLAHYQKAKESWESKYCSVEGLRTAFGGNTNRWWGDYDPATTRRLYHALLPLALLDLYEAGVDGPDDLAPLAYKARVAAKLYARERSRVPIRWAAMAYDGVRSLQRNGKFSVQGMTYEQLYDKYADMLYGQEVDDSKTTSICLKILERSCKSNELIDKMVLQGNSNNLSNANSKKNNNNNNASTIQNNHKQLLDDVNAQLEHDVRLLLQQEDSVRQAATYKALRAVAKVKRRIAGLRRSGSGDPPSPSREK